MISPVNSGTEVAPVAPVRFLGSDPTAPVQPGSPASARDSYQASSRTPLDADRRLAAQKTTSGDNSGQNLSSEGKSKDPGQLDDGQKQEVKELAKQDTEVRAHEQAHMAAAGGAAQGGPTFRYTTGPDGKRYAVGGEVKIAMKTGSTPEETIRNAQQVQSAAMAPGDPSPTDQQTAAAAARMAQDARRQMAAQGSAGSTKSG